MNFQPDITFQEFKTLSIIVFIAMCGMLGIDIHLASLPYIMRDMHTNQAHMQQSVSIFLLGIGSSLLLYGPLSDKFGRRPIVILGLSLATFASFLSAFTHHITAFLLCRLLQGIGSGACMGVGRIIIADIVQGVRLASVGSYFSMVISLSPLFAPALGGYIQHWLGWRANFIALGMIIGLGLSAYILFCPETNKQLNPEAISPKGLYYNYKFLLSHALFMGATLVTGIAMAANAAYATISSFVFQIQFHVSPIYYGWLTAFAGAGGFIGRFVNPLCIQKIGSQNTLLIGLCLLLGSGLWLGFFLMIHEISIFLILIAVFFTLFAQAFVTPNATALALSTFHDIRGSAGALYGSFQMLTAFASSAIIALFTQDGIIVLAIAYTLLGITGISVYFNLVQKKTSSPTDLNP